MNKKTLVNFRKENFNNPRKNKITDWFIWIMVEKEGKKEDKEILEI